MTWLEADEIETYTGRKYKFSGPDSDAISIDDIAHALSNLCRFNGHTCVFYSVAEHSVMVADLLERNDFSPSIVKAGLLHDAQEAYTGDYPRPIKHLFNGFTELTAKADLAIGLALDVDPNDFHSEAVKWADDLALMYEGSILMHNGPGVLPESAVDLDLYCWEPPLAKYKFMEKYRTLTAATK